MNKMTMTLMFMLLAIPLAYAGDWVRPLVAAGSSLWSEGLAGAIYYDGGSVGIGTATPETALEVKNLTGSTIIKIDTVAGTHDSSISFYNQGQKEHDICMDDSAADELKFIRGGNAECAGKDTFTLTQSGLEMGTAMLYFDSPTRWYRSPCPDCSTVGNNFFELDDTSFPIGLDISTLDGGQQGQRITIICSEEESKIEDATGNIQLAGDFDCAVVGIGSTLELIYFDNQEHSYDWHEVSRSVNT